VFHGSCQSQIPSDVFLYKKKKSFSNGLLIGRVESLITYKNNNNLGFFEIGAIFKSGCYGFLDSPCKLDMVGTPTGRGQKPGYPNLIP